MLEPGLEYLVQAGLVTSFCHSQGMADVPSLQVLQDCHSAGPQVGVLCLPPFVIHILRIMD